MLKFLWQDSYTKEPSSSKIWTHICYGVSTYMIIHMQTVSWEILLVYMAVVGSSEIAKKILTMKFSPGSQEQSSVQSTSERKPLPSPTKIPTEM